MGKLYQRGLGRDSIKVYFGNGFDTGTGKCILKTCVNWNTKTTGGCGTSCDNLRTVDAIPWPSDFLKGAVMAKVIKKRISEINIRGRSRKSLGDIDSLADSINRIGLLQPVIITPGGKLIAGRRRIAAFKLIGYDAIPAIESDSFDEVEFLLQAERDENTCREPYTPEDAVHLAKRIRKLEGPKAKAELSIKGSEGGSVAGKGRPKNRGGKSFPTPNRDESKRTAVKAAKAVGMSRPTLEKAEAIVASGDRKLIDEMNKSGKVNGVYKRLVVKDKAKAIQAEAPSLPTGPFRVIVSDPPWRYGSRPDDPTHRAANPYPSMSIEEIKAMPVVDLAHKDCILWLWTTNAHIPESFAIAEAWGFKYKTMLTWTKNKMGLGDWLRGKTEHCLMCVRGKPTVVLTNQTTALLAKASKHSAKPDEFYEMLESLCPGSKLEMFSRKERKGWVQHGDES